MRHGRAPKTISKKLGDLLFVASITKTLSESGTHNLVLDPPHSFTFSEPILHQVLSKPLLHLSKKLDFFNWCRSLRPNYTHSASAYSHIFRTVCRAGYLQEVPNLLHSMKEDGVVVDSQTFKVLLEECILSGMFDFALEILDYMEDQGTSLNPQIYNSVLVALVRKNQVGLALSIFLKLLDAEANFSVAVASAPNSVACNELLVALRRADMRVEFKQLFDKLREKKGFELDTWGYNICIYAFGCWGELGTSLRLFKEMKEKMSSGSGSFGPDLCTYNSMIHVLCKVGKVKDALIIWEELKGSGHEPDAFTYRILIQGCSKTYRIDDASKIFIEMQYNGFRPDTVVYNSLLDGLLKARKLTESCQLFEKMIEDGVRASCWTYNILIDGLFRNGRPEASYTLFCDLKKKGQFVDGITYSIVALQLCKEGLLEEALRLIEEMEGRGFVVDLVTITSLLISLHKHGKWHWTDRLMKHVRDGDSVPNVLKWKADMEAAMKNPRSKRKDYSPMFPSRGDLSEIMSFVTSADSVMESSHVVDDAGIKDEEVSSSDNDQWSSSPHMDQLANQFSDHSTQLFSLSRGQRIQETGSNSFDIDMVNTFLSIFLANGKLNLACKLFEIFSDMGVDSVSYTYNSMMSSFVKKGYFNEAWGILHEMSEKVCAADIATYNVIIQGLGKMGKADIASAVLDTLQKRGGYLDIVMYNTLLNALGKAGRMDEVNMLFEQMKAMGINPDVVTFNTLIEVHSKAGQLKDAYKFLKMMLDSGCSPNHVTDTTLDFLGREIDKLRYRKASFVCDKDDSS
ncbi:Pentatricopeptide repeat-containing protein [Quillaja saponaria]|uniref:Pentatricopeptide repeat-containing protein n=1 Tax=Quillaja saponaria TaxID=32244 RepID=A0AAD7PPG8_QUISA|nr:Pentatricopeptide repeat-containing protein [Quillaja saponaria]KAJ7963387.1 Pentatricopeptide repeat-containing protein [Quillaja saponaria]